ncbi:MAG: hypothetical protein Fur0018_23790 [Anaerolineales bacterium]
MKRWIFLLLIFTLILSACGSKSSPAASPEAPTPAPAAQVIAEGHLAPAQDVFLTFGARGPVTEILVAEGDTVSKGQVLARLGDSEQAQSALQAALAEQTAAQQAYDAFLRNADQSKAQAWQAYQLAQTARAQAQAAWDVLDTQVLQDNIDAAESTMRAREKDMQDAQDTFNRYADLDKTNANRKQAKTDLDTAISNYHAAVQAWEAAQQALDGPRAALDAAIAAENEAKRVYDDILANGTDSEQKAILESRLNAANAQVSAAQNVLAQYTLTAPFAGTVTRVNLTLGQRVGPDVPVIQIADFSTWYIETSDLTELEVVRVSLGQQADISVDALPDLPLTATVSDIAPVFTSKSGDILYTVKLRLATPDPALRWGMTVQVTFAP